MEPAREPAWAEHEKVYLLAEILKAAPISSHVLYNLIRDSNIQQPRWNEMALPHGRSLRSCQMAYNDITATYSQGDYRRPPAPAPLPLPIMYPGSELPKKRPHQPEASTPIGRLLQPRPPHSYPGDFGSGVPSYATALSPVGEPANKKKRGRPTKAEAQLRAQEAAARGEIYPPPRKARTSITTVEPPPGQGDMRDMRDMRPLAHTPPHATPTPYSGAMTPQHTQPEQAEQALELSSSGKKKRGKPTPLELEKPRRAPSDTESPLAYGSTTGDTHRSTAYSSFTPISAPLPSESRDRDMRMEGVEESQPRTTTPHSFKDTVGI
ncbi:hypothetical protein P280DRAFT_326246 [Massarina eburnea CBS 473.64]|uniref:Uncharacterized protein n=1 Tax=Massarina eburnea CBS 473.64 TaxID=1395130 RepID=A0A6A6S0N5_9PLEO|nr:hypothetical protein P280DRAFT_326246 [Massarina eburnea CBS 473.64]